MPPKIETSTINDIDVIRQSLTWLKSGKTITLATVIETWGSAPRPKGSQMSITESGDFIGSISGGCVEGDVVTASLAAIRVKKNDILDYDISNDTAQSVGLSCGGKLKVFIHVITKNSEYAFEKIEHAAKSFCSAWMLINTFNGELIVFDTENFDKINIKSLNGESGFMEYKGQHTWFARAFHPSPRLIIVGAVHIAQSLSSIALMADYEVVLIDPRDTWATKTRFPGIKIIHAWPSDAVNQLIPDSRTAIVTLSHDPKLDDPALISALSTEAFYVGSLGSKRSHSQRIERLKNNGVDIKKIDKIHGPIGLNILANTPFEIAVSIMAQIIQSYQSRNQ